MSDTQTPAPAGDRSGGRYAAKPSPETVYHTAARVALNEAAEILERMLPPGRARSIVLTKIDEAYLWSIASLDEATTLPPVGPQPAKEPV
jgi:hypothetical protein